MQFSGTRLQESTTANRYCSAHNDTYNPASSSIEPSKLRIRSGGGGMLIPREILVRPADTILDQRSLVSHSLVHLPLELCTTLRSNRNHHAQLVVVVLQPRSVLLVRQFTPGGLAEVVRAEIQRCFVSVG